MKNKFKFLGSLLVGVSLYGCNAGTQQVSGDLNSSCDREISENVRESLDGRIAQANAFYSGSGGHDVERYVSLLDDFQGECSELLYICENVRGQNFCYRWASKDNEELRGEICGEYEDYLNKEYDEETAAGAMEECLQGSPAFIY